MIEFYSKNLYEVVEERIRLSSKKILIAVAWMNVSMYEKILLKEIGYGVSVDIILDDNPSNRRHMQSIERLREAGAKVRLVKMSSDNNHMHEKMAIFDDKFLVMGSYNWSENANNNFENLIVTDDNNAIVKAKCEFKEIKALSSILLIMSTPEIDPKYGRVINVIKEDSDVSRGGTEEYDLVLYKFDENRNLIEKEILETYNDPQLEQIYDDEGNEVDNYEQLFDFCLGLVKKHSLKHPIDGILQYLHSQEYDYDKLCQIYKTVWKNRFTLDQDLFYQLDDGDFA